MNEADTRAELIDPKLRESGWGNIEGSKILREKKVTKITEGRILYGGKRAKGLTADYVLSYKGIKLAVIEAKSDEKEVGEGVGQAKQYAGLMQVDFAYATNGKEIYQINMKTGTEGIIEKYPTPEELWNRTYEKKNDWRERFASVPFEDKGGTWEVRYYQEIAINRTLEAIANNEKRILLTLATGTGKTAIAFQIAWKLYQTKWNLKRDGSRRPRILFLADRNILADQAYNAFSAFPEYDRIRISPDEIRRNERVPMNGNVFFTIFQTFMSGTDVHGNPAPYFGDYKEDFFDFVIIDECHRGGANDESNWRDIMEHFNPAVQLGLTATPKKDENVNTYKYFGKPVYIYSLKDGINDGFLTPFKVKRIITSIDTYQYDKRDKVLAGQIKDKKTYTEEEFNKSIEIREREEKRVRLYLKNANQKDKAIMFCRSQEHASVIRDLVNQNKENTDVNYCVRVTSDEGEIGNQFLRDFQDNEKTIPTILTTSQKLTTGVDARNIRNIVLLRPVNSIIEFKQIIGRGTRLYDGKDYFTIYDYVGACHHFSDPEWDGDPLEDEPCEKCGETPCVCEKKQKEPCKRCGKIPCECEKPEPLPCKICKQRPCVCIKKVKVKLADGKVLEILDKMSTMFLDKDGNFLTAAEFIQMMYGKLPEFYSGEEELRKIWSVPDTRKALLERLEEAGFGNDVFTELQRIIDAEKSDIFDVLEFISFLKQPITREKRVEQAQTKIYDGLDDKYKDFIEFVLSKYIEVGVDELYIDKLEILLESKYNSFYDGMQKLGSPDEVRNRFIDFQKYLYERSVG